MSDKEALQEVVYMVNDYVNNHENLKELTKYKLISNLTRFLEENVIHCAMDNNYK